MSTASTYSDNFAERYAQICAEGRARFKDFEELVIDGAARGAWPLSRMLAELILGSEFAAELLLHLAKNPDVARWLAAMPPEVQACWFGSASAHMKFGKPIPALCFDKRTFH